MLVNTSRGTLVKTDDLIAALQSGQISAAALDVTDPEPINMDNPLVKMDNVIINPHLASASLGAVDEAAHRRREHRRPMAVKGEKLPNIVNGVKAVAFSLATMNRMNRSHNAEPSGRTPLGSAVLTHANLGDKQQADELTRANASGPERKPAGSGSVLPDDLTSITLVWRAARDSRRRSSIRPWGKSACWARPCGIKPTSSASAWARRRLGTKRSELPNVDGKLAQFSRQSGELEGYLRRRRRRIFHPAGKAEADPLDCRSEGHSRADRRGISATRLPEGRRPIA